ncbi:lipase [Holotrichia oblita]|uniref:Lipase n=1 Tax=Holotrichia oblita TaxID=644536 RepID=A0ACB9SMS9_HOLOL|nr:lipase [Holotrichia oblita]
MFCCLFEGPPGVSIQDAYVQLFPIDRSVCKQIDYIRDITFDLYTRHNPIQPTVLRIGDDEALVNSHFNFSEPTIFFFHAFFESSTSPTATAIKTAYLQRKEHNIILLNAQRMEAGPWYLTAARNTRVVGEYSAKFIDYLVSKGLHLPSLHLIGLSLGAQMAGVTGQNVKSGRISRITGLDPAGPLFTKWPKSLKLDRSDAEFVDVIHTDAGIFGYPRSIGHVDFWPNAGIAPQPGCRVSEVKKRNPDAIIETGKYDCGDSFIVQLKTDLLKVFCSHWRSYQFYAESVVSEYTFLSMNCESWKHFKTGDCDPEQTPVSMGFLVHPHARGNYYLITRGESPFSY